MLCNSLSGVLSIFLVHENIYLLLNLNVLVFSFYISSIITRNLQHNGLCQSVYFTEPSWPDAPVPQPPPKKGSANYGPHSKSSRSSAFVNKDLLEYSHAHAFTNDYGSSWATLAEFSSWNIDCLWSTKPDMFTLVVHKKFFCPLT